MGAFRGCSTTPKLSNDRESDRQLLFVVGFSGFFILFGPFPLVGNKNTVLSFSFLRARPWPPGEWRRIGGRLDDWMSNPLLKISQHFKTWIKTHGATLGGDFGGGNPPRKYLP